MQPFAFGAKAAQGADPDGYGMVRGYAARSFAKASLSRGENLDEAVSFLEESLRLEEDEWVVLFLLWALCLLGRYDCYPRLLLGIDSGEYRNRCAALHAIEEVLRPQDKENDDCKNQGKAAGGRHRGRTVHN